MLIWIIIFYAVNLLDLLTTYLAMKGLPKEDMGNKEMNPIMAPFIHNKKITYTVKFVGVTLLVLLAMKMNIGLQFLQIGTILISLVVVNNALALYMRRKGKLSLGRILTDKMKIPKAIAFFLLIGIYLIISWGIWLLACV